MLYYEMKDVGPISLGLWKVRPIQISDLIWIQSIPYNVKRSELRFEAWKGVKNREGTPVPRKLIGRLL